MYSGDDDTWPGRRPDFTVASAARVWNALAGGKDNFAVDRDVVRQILSEVTPAFRALPHVNYEFMIRACEYLAGTAGITQYLDCGPGLPIGRHVHDIVQELQPAARVLYVDHDAMALTHARALLATNDLVQVIEADIFKPDELLTQPLVRDFLDFSQPIAVLHTATLHHHPGPLAEIAGVMRVYVDALPAGSYTVISHLLDPEIPALDEHVSQIEKHLTASSLASGWFRTRDEIRDMFPGQDLTDPGIAACRYWPKPDPADPSKATRPDWPRDCLAGGIGYKVSRTQRIAFS
jgi:hypothetical protein